MSIAGKTVEHDQLIGTGNISQNLQGVRMRIPIVDLHRQIRFGAEFQVSGEGSFLRFAPLGCGAEVVEAALPDCDDQRIFQEALHLRDRLIEGHMMGRLTWNEAVR